MMARPYRPRKKYNAGSNGNDAVFPIIILVACGVWAHKAFMFKVEHYALIFGVACSVALALTVIYRLSKGMRSLHTGSIRNFASIDNMTGLQFEQYIAKLLKQRGYSNVRLTEQYDLGVDIIADKDGIRWGIQVKRYSGLVKAEAVRQVVTALKFYNCDKSMVITNSYFSNVAKSLADSNDCILVDRLKLEALQYE